MSKKPFFPHPMTQSASPKVMIKEREAVRLRLAIKEKGNAVIAARNVLDDLQVEKEKLAEAIAKDEAILASIGDGIVVFDTEGKVILANKATEKLTGWSKDELIGKVWYEVVPMVDEKDGIAPPNKRPLQVALTHSKSTTIFYTRKNKSKFPVAVTATQIILKGKLIGVIEVFRDITREKEVDKAKTEFVSIASHGLRTPLTAIDGLVSMILDGEYGRVGKNLKQPLEDINTSSKRLIKLVNDLLSLSRIQAGRLKYNLSDFSISDVVSEVVEILLPLAQQKKLKLLTGHVDKVSVHADRNKVEEIFDNLIGNSLKFTNEGSITILTKVVDDKIEADITDTGIGISKENQQKLFGMFQQLETGSEPVGTGLGLHISRELVRKMGGELWIKKSEVGIGSTFAFSLPIAKRGQRTSRSKNRLDV